MSEIVAGAAMFAGSALVARCVMNFRSEIVEGFVSIGWSAVFGGAVLVGF